VAAQVQRLLDVLAGATNFPPSRCRLTFAAAGWTSAQTARHEEPVPVARCSEGLLHHIELGAELVGEAAGTPRPGSTR